MKLKKVRKIRFGIRFKFSIVMIASMIFVALLIGVAVFNQQENKIRNSLQFLGSTILKGAQKDAEIYLNSKHILYSKEGRALKDNQRKRLIDKIKNSNKNMQQYFSSVVNKEKILDIAFLVDIKWTGLKFNLKNKYSSQFLYFNRTTGRLFSLIGNKIFYNLYWKSGRYDGQLKSTIYSYFMKNVDPNPYLTYAKGREKEQMEFVIIGIPLYKSRRSSAFFEYFKQFQKTTFLDSSKSFFTARGNLRLKPVTFSELNISKRRKIIEIRNKEEKIFKSYFLTKAIKNGVAVPFIIESSLQKIQNQIKSYFKYYYAFNKIPRKRQKALFEDLKNRIGNIHNDNAIVSTDINKTIRRIQRKYRIPLRKRYKEKDPYKSLYQFLSYRRIPVKTEYRLNDLAKITHRSELSGVVGLFLRKSEFYGELNENRSTLINLILSILLRAAIIALFFPTFIIRTISKLTDRALTIGKGNFDEKIDIHGSDELGRLADILNVMSGNLKKAQEDKLVKQRMEAELKTAQQIQAALLPEEIPVFPRLSFGAFYAAQTESGGDYYDFIKLSDGELGIVMADVSGHGVGSGLVMAMTRTLLHTYCKESMNPKKIFERINEYLYENTASNFFVTMFYGILDLKDLSLTYSSAGHNPSIIIRDKKLIELPAGGIALGAVGNSMFSNLCKVQKTNLRKNDLFIQATDGVDEAMDSQNNEFGMERFHNSLLKNYNKNPQGLIDALVKDINTFTKNIPQHDDITIITFKIS